MDLLRQLQPGFPELFSRFGPSCFSTGRCPEGRLSCGQMEAVLARFRTLSEAKQRGGLEASRGLVSL